MSKPTDTKNFTKIQEEWYDKLKEDGFKDLEWVDHKTGKGQATDYIKRPCAGFIKSFNPFTAEHFGIMRHYVSNCNEGSIFNHFLIEAYSEGVTYRDIVVMVNENFDSYVLKDLMDPDTYRVTSGRISIYAVFYRIKDLIARANEWHKLQPLDVHRQIEFGPPLNKSSLN